MSDELTKGIIEAGNQLLAKEREIEAVFSELRFLLHKAQSEVRQAEIEAQRTHLEVYTEREAAKVLRVGLSTLQRLRLKLNLPCVFIGTQVRYTNHHLAQIVEILEKKKRRLKSVA